MMRRKQIIIILALVIVIIYIYKGFKSTDKHYINITNIENSFMRNILIQPNISCYDNLFIIIVTSYVGHVELRSAHRRAMSSNLLRSMNATRIFLLAKIPEREKYITQEAVQDESNIFGDILQGSFVENYRNLTHKHLMGLQWSSHFCSNVSFILKVDDDIVFNINKTYEFLSKMTKRENLIMGYMLNDTIPRRNKQNKWYVTQEEYSKNSYPPYLSGWYYIITPSIAHTISQEAQYHYPFWIDDIFITGILTDVLGIKLRQFPKKFWLEYYELLECCIKDMVISSIQCDYVVGPNGGRNNLIFEFNEALEECNKKNCSKRSDTQILNKVCVNDKERMIFSDGHAEIEHIKL
ncbi:beta-1,3-galactosyltransferase 5-like [Battus philenor]|uniref:beta-1,3-galactosyltransferase 5-like n=1 Tax=Battus philenor TaxID=42288 RepID=UPI0035CEC0AD